MNPDGGSGPGLPVRRRQARHRVLEIAAGRFIGRRPGIDRAPDPSTKLPGVDLGQGLTRVVIGVFSLGLRSERGGCDLLEGVRGGHRSRRRRRQPEKFGGRSIDRRALQFGESRRQPGMREGSGEEAAAVSKVMVRPDDPRRRVVRKKVEQGIVGGGDAPPNIRALRRSRPALTAGIEAGRRREEVIRVGSHRFCENRTPGKRSSYSLTTPAMDAMSASTSSSPIASKSDR